MTAKTITAPSSRKKSDTPKILAAIAVYVLFQFILPVVPPLTRAGMGVLGIFGATLVLWITVGIGWSSVVALAMLSTTNIATPNVLLKESWGNWMIPFLVFCFLLNYAMAETGLSRRIALWFVTRDFVRGKPWLIMGSFLFSTFLVSTVVTSSAVAVMFLSIGEQIFENTGYTEDEKLPEATIASVGWLATTGQSVTPLSHTVTLMVIGLIVTDFGFNLSVLQYSLVGLAFGVVFFLGYLLVFRYVLRPDVSKLANLDIDKLKSTVPPMGKKEKIVAVAFVLLLVFWVCPDLIAMIPPLKGVGEFMGYLGQCIPVMVCVGILAAMRCDGKPVIDLPVAASKINWISIFMLAFNMCLAYVMNLESGGITLWIKENVGAALAGVPASAFVAIAILWILIQTDFMANMVAAVMYVVIIPIAVMLPGVNPISLAVCIAIASNIGLATPAACPVVAMISATKWVRVSYLMKYAWPIQAVAFLVIYFVAYPLGCVVFPY